MESPDFSKYDETQLKQILTRIDRERFPERVTAIEARLAEREQDMPSLEGFDKARNSGQKTVDPSSFVVKPFPDATKRVFGPAAPFFVIAIVSLIVARFVDSTAHPTVAGILPAVGFVAMFGAFSLVFFRLYTLACPVCRHECKKAMLPDGNWGAICKQCQVHWDTGIGSD